MTEEEEQDYDQPQKVQTLYEIIGCEPTATFDEIKHLSSIQIEIKMIHMQQKSFNN